MLKRILLAAALLLAFPLFQQSSFAATPFDTAAPQKIVGLVVSSCGSQSLTTGSYSQLTMDTTGHICGSGGSGSPGGSNQQIQYNNSSAFGGVQNFTWDGTHLVMGVPFSSLSTYAQSQVGSYSANDIAWTTGRDPFQVVLDRDGSDASAIAESLQCYITNVVAHTSQQCTALSTFVYATGSAEYHLLTGITANNGYAGSSTVDESVGLWVAVPTNTGGGTIAQTKGIDIENQSGTGISNSDALYIGNQGTGANTYAIQVLGGKNDLGPQSTKVGSLLSNTNCDGSSLSNPVTCGSAAFGMFVVPAGSTSVVVDTTAMHNQSEVFIQSDTSIGGFPGVTCNTATTSWVPQVTARSPNTSFTVTIASAPITNPACFSYMIVN